MSEALPASGTAGVSQPVAIPEYEMSAEELSLAHDAVATFIAGDHKEAIRRMMRRLKGANGRCSRRFWYVVFDMFQAADHRREHETLSDLFHAVFGLSAPAWENWRRVDPSVLTRNVLMISGFPSQLDKVKINDFLSASRQMKGGKIDFSRLRLESANAFNERGRSMRNLAFLFSKVRSLAIPVVLMGDQALLDDLHGLREGRGLSLPDSDDDGEEHRELAWLLILDLLQFHGYGPDFEDLALSYMERYGKSVPGYEPSMVLARLPNERTVGSSRTIPSVIDQSNVSILEDLVESRKDTVSLDLSKVVSIDLPSVRRLSNLLDVSGVPASAVKLVWPTEVVKIALEMAGVSDRFTLVPRKR